MEIRLFEAGKPEGERAVDARFTIDKGSIRIGGDGSDVVVAGASGTAAEIAVAGGKATLTRPGRARVSVGGREVDRGGTVDLGIETLVAIEGTELVYKVEGGAGAPGGPESERPSYMARDVLKQVYAVLGVPEGDLPTLVVYDRDEKLVKRLDLGPDEGEVTIGRGSDNRLVLYHASVSKTHARVVRDGVGFLVYDLQSRNGVEVNEIRVQGKQRLKSGDRIRIGEFTLRFVDPKAATQDLSASVPDLKRLEKAKPGEHVEVGDKSAARVEETQTFHKRAAAAAAAAAGGGATPSVRMAGGAPAADGMTPSMRLAAGLGGPPGSPKPPADPVKAGGGALMAILIGVGVLVLLAAIGLIVLATKH